ncbi:MAG: hypothetical protein JSV80_01750 [Acidobacteriota bacterium]|nr:MAG: hypothetical protein JSV80_01750 [Acidobacteriota bacterium]
MRRALDSAGPPVGFVMLSAMLLAPLGCGGDFLPPPGEVTGTESAPLGQVVDAVVELPFLTVAGASSAGARLELELRIDGAGDGQHPARVRYLEATLGGQPAVLEDLSTGLTDVRVAGESWSTGRIGPVSIEGAGFEFILRGTISATDRFFVEGTSWESQSGLDGTFRAWRRHRFALAGTDFFASGRVAIVELGRGGAISVRNNLSQASSDPVLRQTGHGLFVINRFSHDNLQRLDPAANFATSWQASTGQGSNPHDVLLLDERKLYVTRFEPPFSDLAVLLPQGGSFRGSIPLDQLAENPDDVPTPRPDRMAHAGGVLFVGLQDVDRTFTQYGEAKLAVVDPELDEVAGVVRLGGKSPGTIETLVGTDGRERLYVALAGIFPGLLPQELSGGIAVVDVANRAFERWALDDDDAGGNINAFALAREDLGYAVVSDAQYVSRLVAFDPRSGELRRTLLETSQFVPEIEVDSAGVLAVPDPSFVAPQLCLYRVPASADENEQPLGCVALELPPFSIEPLD